MLEENKINAEPTVIKDENKFEPSISDVHFRVIKLEEFNKENFK